jgi:hypothetical protein
MFRAGGNLLGARWRPGVLEIRRETIRWTDAKDPSRNVFLPLGRLASHSLVCRSGPKGEVCDVWTFRTVEGETERFQDPEAETGACARAYEIFRAILESSPATPADVEPAGPAR